jgi:hypothetical protein
MSTRMSLTGAAEAAGALPGVVLGGLFGVVAKVRRDKPLHPRGQVGDGVLRVTDPVPWLGIPLLAAEVRRPCVARWSRAAGLPAPLPDVEGLALRIDDPDAAAGADLLFSSTGTGSVTRFVLAPRLPRSHGPQSTLLPVASRMGAVVFLVTPTDDHDPPRRFDLSIAHGGSSWMKVAVVEVDSWGPDRPTRFDPVRNLLPGTEQYPFVRGLREPSYLFARRAVDPRPDPLPEAAR